MLNIFTLVNGRLFQEEIESLEELTKFQPIWVDLEAPTVEEKRWVKQYYGLSIPEDAMDEDIEESARFYEEDNGEMHIRSDFLIDDDEEPRTVRVAFILNQHNADLKSRGVLFSIHEEDLPVFRLVRMRARRAPGLIEDAKEVLLKLFDADAEYSADTLENIYDEFKKVSTRVLSGDVTDAVANEVLGAIARQEDLNSRIRRNAMDTRRVAVLALHGLNAEEIRWVLGINAVAFRQRLTSIRKAMGGLPPSQRAEALALAYVRDPARTVELQFGLVRRALKAALGGTDGIGTHDADGHLIVLRAALPGRAHTSPARGNE